MNDAAWEGLRPSAMPRIVTPYQRMTGSSRVRVFDWLEHFGLDAAVVSLSKAGRSDIGSLPSFISAHLRSAMLLARSPSVLVHREASLLGRRWPKPGRNTRLVYDLDDAIYVSGDSRSRRSSDLAKRSSLVIAGNQFIADWATSIGAEVVVIPSCVEPDLYQKKLSYEITDTPRMVWLGSATTEPFLEELAPVLVDLNKSIGLEVHVIGAPKPIHTSTLAEFTTRHIWSEQLQYSVLAGCDFGVMPMPDTRFTRGKCAYKLLQYGAARLPVIASPVGVNEEILREAGNLSAASLEEWYESITTLVHAQSSERALMGAKLAELVSVKYSFEANRISWTKAVGLARDG